jgi:hypothetical protein
MFYLLTGNDCDGVETIQKFASEESAKQALSFWKDAHDQELFESVDENDRFCSMSEICSGWMHFAQIEAADKDKFADAKYLIVCGNNVEGVYAISSAKSMQDAQVSLKEEEGNLAVSCEYEAVCSENNSFSGYYRDTEWSYFGNIYPASCIKAPEYTAVQTGTGKRYVIDRSSKRMEKDFNEEIGYSYETTDGVRLIENDATGSFSVMPEYAY